MQLALAIEELLKEGSPLIVVRAKDRLNNPTSFGYADFLMNVRLPSGPHQGHVGELQARALNKLACVAFVPPESDPPTHSSST